MDIKNDICKIEIKHKKEKRFLEVKIEIEEEIDTKLNQKVYRKTKY